MFLHSQEDLKIRFKFVMYDIEILWLIIFYWLGFLLLWTFGELSIEFDIFTLHKLSRASPPLQVVNGYFGI